MDFQQIQLKQNNSNALKNNYINHVFEDKSGVMWIATERFGVNKLIPKNKPFKLIGEANPAYSDLKNINTIIADKSGDLLIGTRGNGLFKYEFSSNSKPDSFEGKLLKLNWTNHKNIRSLIRDDEENYWLAVANQGIHVFNKNEKLIHKFVHDPTNSNSLSDNYVFKIFQDSRGMVWIGTWGGSWGGGLDMYNPKTNTFINFCNDPNDDVSLTSSAYFEVKRPCS